MAEPPSPVSRVNGPDATASGLTLGSASPRRADLLTRLGVHFTVEVVDLDERALVDENENDPRVVVETISLAKFAAFPCGLSSGLSSTGAATLLLTADTLVACNGIVMGKPTTNDELVSMLSSMSAGELQIATAVAVGLRGTAPKVETVTTTVALRSLSSDEIQSYVATGAGMDKAGGLALQSQAKPFIHAVHGCWSNVLGLPLCAVSRLLATAAQGDETGCSVDLCGKSDH